MKILKKSILIFGAVVTLFLAGFNVSAESDGTNDIWHWYYSETAWGWSLYTVSDRPDIDITDVSYTKNGLELTLSMTVAGTIQNSTNYFYIIYSGSPDNINYWVMYTNGFGVWGATNISGVTGGPLTDIISPDGKTLTATFTLVEDTTITPYANAIYYTQVGNIQTSEWWQDWYPNEYFQGQQPDGNGDTNGNETDGNETDDGEDGGTNNGGDSGSGTPGFEIITLIVSVATVLILLRRKK